MLDRIQALRRAQGLGALDLKSIQRDALLRSMVLLPVLVALAARLVLPLVLHRVGASLELDLVGYYPLIMSSALLLITPIVYGVIVGFLLLDQRDDGTLLALRVTPLSLRHYLGYRLAAPMLISFGLTPVALTLAGPVQLRLPELLVVVAVATPLAPLCALALVAVAENKVQDFALVKGASVLMIAPLAANWVPFPWQLAFGLLPTYWPTHLYAELLAGAASAWLYGCGALLIDALLIGLLLRRFERGV